MSGNDVTRDSNVLRMGAATETSRRIQQFEQYWNKVRGNRLVPSRCEIDPRGLEGGLSNAFILERITGGLARFRIAGAHLADLTNLELRQMPISALFLPSSREVLSEALEAAFDEPAMVRMSIISPSGFGRSELKGEMILLPLRSDLGDIDRILGALVLDGKIGRTPRRIEIVSQRRQTLVGYAGEQHAARDELPSSRTNRASEAAKERIKERIAKINETKTANSDRGHLKLVINND